MAAGNVAKAIAQTHKYKAEAQSDAEPPIEGPASTALPQARRTRNIVPIPSASNFFISETVDSFFLTGDIPFLLWKFIGIFIFAISKSWQTTTK